MKSLIRSFSIELRLIKRWYMSLPKEYRFMIAISFIAFVIADLIPLFE
jgi:hypothetical protein